MNIRSKILLILSLSIGLLITGLYFVISESVLKGYLDIEQSFTQKNTQRIRQGMDRLIKEMHTKSSDWATWDDTYEFAQDHNQEYIDSNFVYESLNALGLDYILLLDTKFKPIHGATINHDEEKLEEMPQILTDELKNDYSFQFNDHDVDQEFSGIFSSKFGKLIITARPILKSNGEGPIAGTLIFAHKFQESDLTKLNDLTAIHIKQIDTHDNSSLNVESKKYWIDHDTQLAYVNSDENETHILSAFKDCNEKIAIVLQGIVPREIYHQGLQTVRSMLSVSIGTVITLLFILLLALDKIVLNKLASFTNKVQEVKFTDHIDQYILPITGQDEFATLSENFNSMINEIQTGQDKVKASIAALEQKNIELIATQQQLIQSQKVEAIGKLAGGIAHDFNNILTGILGYSSSLLKKFANNEELVKKLSIIKSSAEKAATLTKQLLTYSRQTKKEHRTVDLYVLLNELDAMLVPQKNTKNIRVTIDSQINLFFTNGESSQLTQVFMNLFLNAFDALPDNKGWLYINTSKEILSTIKHTTFGDTINPGSYIKITLQDNGCGIPSDILPKIFDPFFTTKGIGKGTGLGLSTVLGIIKSHGGYLDVISTAGSGTTFIVWLKASEEALSENTTAKTLQQDTSSSLQNKNILVVEDDPTLRGLMQDLLSRHNATVLVAENGNQAVALFKSNMANISTIVMDILMPEKDGITASEEIRQINKEVPILFCSGYANDDLLARMHTIVKSEFVTKPYDEAEIVAKIAVLSR